jgi:hypothetical protein
VREVLFSFPANPLHRLVPGLDFAVIPSEPLSSHAWRQAHPHGLQAMLVQDGLDEGEVK